MKNKLFITCLIIFALAALTNAEDPSKILIADGTRQINGTAIYSNEAARILEKTKIGNISLPKRPPAGGLECGENDYFRVNDSAEGFFITEKFKSRAYLYSDCSRANNLQYQGIIVFHEDNLLAHYAYYFLGDKKISAISDFNGNALDELAIFSDRGTGRESRTEVRLIELLPQEIHKFGAFEIRSDNTILLASKIYVEKQAPGKAPIFYEEELKTDGKVWRIIQPIGPVTPNPETTNYVKSGSSFGVTDVAFGTLILQAVLFLLLLPVTLYAIFKGLTTPAQTDEKPVENKTSAPEPDVPKLRPLNCPNCGAGVPLRDENMSCPSCQTSFPVPEEYQETRLFRNQIAKNLKNATSYWNRAKFLTSGWVRWGIFLLVIWLIASPIIIGLAGNKGNKSFYLSFFGAKFFGLAALAWLFWIFTLSLTAGMISPRTRKILPALEKTENLGHAETASCSQCGGTIQYAKSDIAAICGYCGIETYRVKLAWKVRNAVNDIRQKSSFSLIEAMRAFREALDNILYTPVILMFILLILPALLFGVFYVLDLIGVTDLIDFLDNLF